MKWTIWNADLARAVKGNLSWKAASRYAGLLEGFFGNHYTVIRG